MKRSTMFIALVLVCFGYTQNAQAQEYDPSASKELFDFSPFNETTLLNLFYDAQQQGRQYPTTAEFEAAGFNMMDIEFVRSHVRPHTLINDQANQLVSGVKNTRRLWMNIPMGTAKLIGGYPGTNTGDDTFTMWNYTHLFGSWNHGLFQAPGAWVDAAHQNGTDILSGIKFFESWTAGSQPTSWMALVTTKNGDGTYKYVKPLISLLQFFGSDGFNYNFEAAGYDNADMIAFHKALYKEAEARGFNNFHIGLYTQNSSLSASNSNALFGNSEGRTADAFINYSGGDFISSRYMTSSENVAKNAMGTTDGLYAGVWIVNMNRSWTNLAGKDIGAVLWGEHANSRFWSYNDGTDAKDFQANYQALLERTMSGGNRNPANRPTMKNTGNEWGWNGTTPPLSGFGGLATYFPERSGIQGKLPFHTYFNTGIGEIYAYKGKRTHGNWYNLSTQDIVPTYRWLQYAAGTTTPTAVINPEFTIEDAYMGGSCLRLTGTGSGSADIILFRTALTASSDNVYAKIAVKTGKEVETDTHLSLIVKVGSQWKAFPVGTTMNKTWEEKTIELTGISPTDQIDFIGLRMTDVTAGYKIYVGELQINDAATVRPAEVKDLMAEVKKETTTRLSVKLNWSLDREVPATGLLYNDDADIDHFEVLYKNGPEGRISVVSHVQGWSAFVGDVPMAEDEQPYFGVRAVSTDLKTYSAPQWIAVGRSSNVPEVSSSGVAYGVSELNPSSEGYQTAITSRFLTQITSTGASITNCNYTCNQAGPVEDLNYVDATQTTVIKARQGDVININYSYFTHSDGLQYCVMKGYADWNINGFFEGGTDEVIVEQGISNQKKNNVDNLKPFSFTVPTDAVCGESRIRIVFSDAWFPHPGPVGLTSKGFSLDLSIEVSGDNPQRQPPASIYDEGIADEPEGMINDDDAVHNIAGQASEVTMRDGILSFSNVEKAWIYTTDGKLLRFVKNPNRLSLNAPRGTYIIKMQNGNVLRTRKVNI